MSTQQQRKFLPGTILEYPGKSLGMEAERQAGNDVWISTEARDASGLGDILRADGGDFTDFMKNPVVFWDHGLRLDIPIARCPETPQVVSVDGVKKISAKLDWVPWGESPRIDEIHRLWDGKFINALSVRIIIKEAEPFPGHERDWWPPLDITQWTLREFSVVGVPANQDALRKSMRWLQSGKQLRQQRRREKALQVDELIDDMSQPDAGALAPGSLAALFTLYHEAQKTLEILHNGRA